MLTVNSRMATDAVIPERTAFEEFPRELEDGWFCTERQTMEDQVIRNLGVTDYLLCDFRNRDTGAIASGPFISPLGRPSSPRGMPGWSTP